MAEDNKIIFRKGEETGIVIEKTKEQFDHSLFREQYKQAFTIINDIIARTTNSPQKDEFEKNISNVIAFCGDRGEGKTSALTTVRRILHDTMTFKVAQEADLFPYGHVLENGSNMVLPLVDPSFFDEQHNIVELIIGQMYEKVVQDSQKPNKSSEISNGEYRSLMENFANAKKCLAALDKKEDLYDAISELSVLAANVRLRKAIADLFQCYLKYYKKSVLVIGIDDIDLNMTEAYEMAENIRKYLNHQQCIVLMAVKVEQLLDAIRLAISENVKYNGIISDEQITDMAQKYVTKFIPEGHRVIMPSPNNIIENKMYLYERNGELLKDINKLSVKETIVRLIFNKTRFLFYNSRSVSPIVPHNLREINQLIGLLVTMPNIYENDERLEDVLLSNKTTFKNYFYHSWIHNNLNEKDKDFAVELAEYSDIISVNKFVVSYLNSRLNDNKENRNIDGLYDKIVLPENKSHNISVGDVYYVIKQIEAITTDNDIKMLLFFVRSYYSMKLYELYDEATTQTELRDSFIGEAGAKSDVQIYKYDSIYEGTNTLQKFLNGGYFTYISGSLINDIAKSNEHRDERAIDGKKLAELLESCNKQFLNYINKKNIFVFQFPEDFKRKVQRCEYFILCTTYQLDGKAATRNRRSVNPPFIGVYENIKMQYLAFDFLSIFYNIVNIPYAFKRFGKDGTLFYRYIKRQPWSLISQMTFHNAGEKWPEKADKEKILERYHKLLSDGCIRVSEVQQSIVEELTKNRLCNKHKDTGENTYKLRWAYKDIQELKISLYPYSSDDKNDPYKLPFNFLTPIIEYLKNEEEGEFNEIFTFITHDSHKKEMTYSEIFPSLAENQKRKRDKIIEMLCKDQPNLANIDETLWDELFPNNSYTKKELKTHLNEIIDRLTPYLK